MPHRMVITEIEERFAIGGRDGHFHYGHVSCGIHLQVGPEVSAIPRNGLESIYLSRRPRQSRCQQRVKADIRADIVYDRSFANRLLKYSLDVEFVASQPAAVIAGAGNP